MRSLVVFSALLAVPATLAAEQQQFDLVCRSGKSEVRYRVDVAKGEACSGVCDRVWKLGPTTASEYKLMDRQRAFAGDSEIRITVNRQTGAYHYYSFVNGRPDMNDGICEPAAFSGFPPAKF